MLFAVLILGLVVAAVAGGGISLAQESPSYNLEWHVIGGGGGPMASTSYRVNSTAGQGAAGPPVSAGHSYVVSGGYWFAPIYPVYLPVVMRGA